MLETDNLKKSFGGLKAVVGASLKIDQGQIVGLIGPNGAGKTTLFNLISGFLKTDSGATIFKGQNITNIEPYMICRLGMARTFQQTRIFPEMTILENMLVAPKDNVGENIFETIYSRRTIKRDQQIKIEKAKDLLQSINIYDRRNDYAKDLPYGKQKELELMRAVMTLPELLLLDEPTAGVSAEYTQNMMNYIQELRVKDEITFLIIEHKMSFLMRIADYIYVLDHGKIISSGSPEEIKKDPKVINAYLGEAS